MLRPYGLSMPEEMYVSSGHVYAAFNRIMGPDRNGNSIVGYFACDYQLFAWSYMNDHTKDVGTVADGWPVNYALHQWDGYKAGERQRCVITLVRPAVEGDI